jgi:hypothetical protein
MPCKADMGTCEGMNGLLMHVNHREYFFEVVGYNCAGKWHKIFCWVCISFVSKVKYPVRSEGKQ